MNFNRPARRSFDLWIADLQALAGVRDVSQEDAAVQEAFAGDPQYQCECGAPANHSVSALHTKQQLCCACYVAAGYPPADWHSGCMGASYARAEMADGIARERNPREISE